MFVANRESNQKRDEELDTSNREGRQKYREPILQSTNGSIRSSHYYSAKHTAMLFDYQRNGASWPFEKFKEFFCEGHLQHIVGVLTHFNMNYDYLDPLCAANGNFFIDHFFTELPKIFQVFDLRIPLPPSSVSLNCNANRYSLFLPVDQKFMPLPNNPFANNLNYAADHNNLLSWLLMAHRLLCYVIRPALNGLKSNKHLARIGAISQLLKQQIDQLQIEIKKCHDQARRVTLQQQQKNLQSQADQLDSMIGKTLEIHLLELSQFIKRETYVFLKADGFQPGLIEKLISKIHTADPGNVLANLETGSTYTAIYAKYQRDAQSDRLVDVVHRSGKAACYYPFAIGLICAAQRELSKSSTTHVLFNKIALLFETRSWLEVQKLIIAFNIKEIDMEFIEELVTNLRTILIKCRFAPLDKGLERTGLNSVSYITAFFWHYYEGDDAYLSNDFYKDEVTRSQIISVVEQIKQMEKEGVIIVAKQKPRLELTTKGLWLLIAYLVENIEPPVTMHPMVNKEVINNAFLTINHAIFTSYTFAQLQATFLYFYEKDKNSSEVKISTDAMEMNSDTICTPAVTNKGEFIQCIKQAVIYFKEREEKGEKLINSIQVNDHLSQKGLEMLKDSLASSTAPTAFVQQAPALNSYQNAPMPGSANSHGDRQEAAANIPHATAIKSTAKGKERLLQVSSPEKNIELETLNDANKSTDSSKPLLMRKDKSIKSSLTMPAKSHYGSSIISQSQQSAVVKKIDIKTPESEPLNNHLRAKSPIANKQSFNMTKHDIVFLAREYFNCGLNLFTTGLRDNYNFGSGPIIYLHEQHEFWYLKIDPYPECTAKISENVSAYSQYMTTSYLSKNEIMEVFNSYIPSGYTQLLFAVNRFNSSYPKKNHVALANTIITLCQQDNSTIADIIQFLTVATPDISELDDDFLNILDYVCYRYDGKCHSRERVVENSLPNNNLASKGPASARTAP